MDVDSAAAVCGQRQVQESNIQNLLLCVEIDKRHKTDLRTYAVRMYGAVLTLREHIETIPENRSAETAAEVYIEALAHFRTEIDIVKRRDLSGSNEYDTLLHAQFMLAEPYFREQNQRNHTCYPTTLDKVC